MAQLQWMSKKPTSYLDVMRQEEPKKFNLFDFGSVKTPEPIQTPQMNFWQPISQKNVTNFSDLQLSKPTTTQNSSGFSLFSNKKYLPKQKVKEIIDWRPEWVEPIDLFTQLEKNGYIMEWYNDKVEDYPEEKALVDKLWERFNQFTKTKTPITNSWLNNPNFYLEKTWALWKALNDVLWYWIMKAISPETKQVIVDTIWEDNLKKLDQVWQIIKKQEEAIKTVPWWTEALDITWNVLASADIMWVPSLAKWIVTAPLKWWKLLLKWAKKVLTKPNISDIDIKTIDKIREWVRPSNVWIDTTWKYKMQEDKLLKWVKEVVNEWYTPKNAKEAMEAISKTKQKIWSKVQEANKKVNKTSNWNELADDIYNFTNDIDNDDLFRANPELEAELIKYAEWVRWNKRFESLTQDNLQELLTQINSKIPSNSFLKQLDSNPLQTQKNTVLSSILRDKIENNLMDTLWITSQDLRNSYWAVRQLEKDLAKRYWVYARQNPKWLLDFFWIEAIPDIAMWIITWNVWQVAKWIIQKWIVGKIKNINNPNNIIRDIFEMQKKVKGKQSTIQQIPLQKEPLQLPPWKKEPIITPQTKENAVIQQSKQDLQKAKIWSTTNNTMAENYDLAKQTIVDTNNVKQLEELKEDIKDLWLAKEKELLDEIDIKIEWIKELEKVDSLSDWLYGKYGKNLIEKFKVLYKNEIRNKSRNWADKYSDIEWQTTPAFQKFKDAVEEYLEPWDNKSTQEIYDDIKWQLANVEKVKDINITKNPTKNINTNAGTNTANKWDKKLLKKEPQTTPLISWDKTPQVLETPNKDMVVLKPKVWFKIWDKKPLKKEPITAEKVASDTTQAKENKPLLKKENISNTKETLTKDNIEKIKIWEEIKTDYFTIKKTNNWLEIIWPNWKGFAYIGNKNQYWYYVWSSEYFWRWFKPKTFKTLDWAIKYINTQKQIIWEWWINIMNIMQWKWPTKTDIDYFSMNKQPKPLLKKENLEKAKEMFKKDDDLIKEAKKYESFEDFKKAQGQELYHWTNIVNIEWINKKWFISWTEKPTRINWIWFSYNKDTAKIYWDTVITSFWKTKNTINTNSKEFEKISKLKWNLTENILNKWYDAVIDWENIAIINPKNIKTETQLKEIYNKANPTKKLLSKEKVVKEENLINSKTWKPIKVKVYHWTEKDFTDFDNKFLWSNTWNTPTNKAGFSFTDNIEVAKTFWKNIKEKEVILNNPLVINAKGQDYWQFKHILNDRIEYAQKKLYDWVIVKNYKDAWLLSKWDYIQSNHIIEFPKQKIAKVNIENNLNSLTKSNIDEIASKITTDTTKLAKVKEVIQKYLKEYGENIKNYLWLLADDIADIVGWRAKLLWWENAKLFDKSRWEQAKEMSIKKDIENNILIKTPDEKSSIKIVETTPNKEYTDLSKFGVNKNDEIIKIQNIKVDESNLRKWIGTDLMNSAIKEIKKSWKDIVYLQASPWAEKISLNNLTKFYERFWFKTFEKQDTYNLMMAKVDDLKQVSKMEWWKAMSVSDDLITSVEEDLIYKYTQTWWWTSKPMWLQEQKKVNEVLNKLPDNKEQVYSWLKLTNDQYGDLLYSDWDIWTSKRLLSSSTERNVAQWFMDYNPKNLQRVFLKINWWWKDISWISWFNWIWWEKEVLFPIWQKFKVEKISYNDFELTPIYEQATKPKLLKKATVSDDLIDWKINWDKQLDKKFTYKINCVDCDDWAKIWKMVDWKFDEEITYKDFLKAVSEEDIRKVLKIPSNINVDNWANKFYRSIYEWEPAYYIQSSWVEWVWTNKNKIKLTKPKLLKKAN